MFKKLKILLAFLRTRAFYDEKALRAFQAKKLEALLTGLNSRFYPHSKNLDDFPIISKKIFMENFDSINTQGITHEKAFVVALRAEESRDFSNTLDGVTVGLSSGTSGSRGLFLVSEEESAQWAGYILRRMLPRPYLQRHRIAFFLRANSNLYESLQSTLIAFSFFDLEKPLEEHIEALNAFSPTLLIAPAQVLRLLALHPNLAIAPKRIISVAEVLEEDDKRIIEKRFAQKVHQVYQCTEGFLAHTCEHGTLHLNEDLIWFEKVWLDEAHQRFSPIITDFNRKTQPIIRYRLDDVLILKKEPCPCGSAFTALEKVEGRCDDILHMLDTEGREYLLFPDFIRRALISIEEPLYEYEVILKEGVMHIFIAPFSLHVKVDEALQALYKKKHLCAPKHLFYPYVPKPLEKKRRRIQQQ
jgi:putative adenylate-forming enzyme